MNKTTVDLVAAYKVFRRWVSIIDDPSAKTGAGHCFFCFLYNRGSKDKNCLRCPIAQMTGARYCRATPYADVVAVEPGDLMALKISKIREIKFLREVFIRCLRADRLYWKGRVKGGG